MFKPGLEVCLGPDLARELGRQMRGDFSNELGQHMRGDFSNGPDRHMRGDFSNGPGRAGPGRAGKKRNEFFNGRVWLQKKEDE